MADMADRDKALAAHWKSRMETDFIPGYTPERTPPNDTRIVNAVEYAAYQLGQMNRNLARLVEVLERRGD